MLNYFQQKMSEREMDKKIPHSQVKGLCCFQISEETSAWPSSGSIDQGLSWALFPRLSFRLAAANFNFYFQDWKTRRFSGVNGSWSSLSCLKISVVYPPGLFWSWCHQNDHLFWEEGTQVLLNKDESPGSWRSVWILFPPLLPALGWSLNCLVSTPWKWRQ